MNKFSIMAFLCNYIYKDTCKNLIICAHTYRQTFKYTLSTLTCIQHEYLQAYCTFNTYIYYHALYTVATCSTFIST